MSRILYPKPLPDLIKQSIILESGFTLTEILALQNGWRLLKRRFYYHSTKIFMDFFNENDPLLERFRNKITGKFNLTNLYQHPQHLLNIYGNLIESGLNKVTYINLLLTDVSHRHKLYGVTYDEIKLYTNHIAQHIIEYLDKIKSTTFVTGLNKLNELINFHHYEKGEEEENKSSNHSEKLD